MELEKDKYYWIKYNDPRSKPEIGRYYFSENGIHFFLTIGYDGEVSTKEYIILKKIEDYKD